MIQISQDIFVDSKDFKDISLIENPASVRISYYTKVEKEHTIYFTSVESAKEFKKHLLRNITSEASQTAYTANKQAIAADILQKIRELLDDNS